jgi:flagellar capping protein FliD
LLPQNSSPATAADEVLHSAAAAAVINGQQQPFFTLGELGGLVHSASTCSSNSKKLPQSVTQKPSNVRAMLGSNFNTSNGNHLCQADMQQCIHSGKSLAEDLQYLAAKQFASCTLHMLPGAAAWCTRGTWAVTCTATLDVTECSPYMPG